MFILILILFIRLKSIQRIVHCCFILFTICTIYNSKGRRTIKITNPLSWLCTSRVVSKLMFDFYKVCWIDYTSTSSLLVKILEDITPTIARLAGYLHNSKYIVQRYTLNHTYNDNNILTGWYSCDIQWGPVIIMQ